MPLLFLALFLLPIVAGAEDAYKVVRPDGSVEFTDRQQEGAQPIRLDAAQHYHAKPAIPPPGSRAPKASATGYSRLAIVVPGDGAVIQRHDGPHIAEVDLEPPLSVDQGHRLVFRLDGEVVGVSTEPRLLLGDLYRGEHTLQVAVIDAQHKVLIESSPVTFHIRQRSRLFQ